MASNAEKEVAFAKAIEAVFNRWSLLNLAIEHDFSGNGDSLDKAEWLYDCVLNYFKNNSMQNTYYSPYRGAVIVFYSVILTLTALPRFTQLVRVIVLGPY